MSALDTGFAGIAGILLLMALRVPIGAAMGLVSILGVSHIRGFDVAMGMLRSLPFEYTAHWALSTIPMFVLMGAVAHHSGISSALFRAAYVWLGRLPGGLAIAANIACAGFSAASGSSMATAATMGRLAIPEMLRYGYQPGLATGVVAAAGTLGSLIPPSVLLILFGIFAQVSITKLLIAGILPGLLTAFLYAAMIYVRVLVTPSLAPGVAERFTWRQRWHASRDVWPLLLIVVGIIGGLYGGVFTPTEAGAAGAFLTFVIAALQRRLTVAVARESVVQTLITTAQIFFVVIGAVLFQRLLTFSRVPNYLGDFMGIWAQDPVLLVVAVSVVYIVLGMFLSPVGLMLVTLPLVLPMFQALHVDLIWVGILVIKYLEIGLVTPPVGLNVYVIKGVVGRDVRLEQIFAGVLWFILCDIIVIALLVMFPDIVLFLPNLMD